MSLGGECECCREEEYNDQSHDRSVDSLDGLIDIDRIEPQSREDYDDKYREWESLPYRDESRSDIHMDDPMEYIEHNWELVDFYFMQRWRESKYYIYDHTDDKEIHLLYECWLYWI